MIGTSVDLATWAATAKPDDVLPPPQHGQVSGGVVLVDSCSLPVGRLARFLLEESGTEVLAPLVQIGPEWRRAKPDDRASATLLSAKPPLQVECVPSPGGGDQERLRVAAAMESDTSPEHWLPVEQTNELVAVGDRYVVKWQVAVSPGPVAPTVLGHLAEVGFADTTPQVAAVTWDGILVGQVLRLLPGASEGWTWFVDRVRAAVAAGHRPETETAAAAGDLLGRYHEAMLRPSTVLPRPLTRLDDLTSLAAAYEQLAALVAAAAGPATTAALRPWRGALAGALEVLGRASDVAALQVHGDAHVGQLLPWEGGLALGDFDGSPMLPAEQRGRPLPAAVDVAAMGRSLDHLARVVEHEVTGSDRGVLREWSREARAAMLDAYRASAPSGVLDDELRVAVELLSVLHELGYADQYAPCWRYVPLAVLRDGPAEVATSGAS